MKRMISLLMAAALVLSLVPAGALATQGTPEGQTPSACICEGKCTEENVNSACPVCGAEGADLTVCKGEASQPEQSQEDGNPPAEPQEQENENPPVEQENPAPVCTCTTKCAEGSVNSECPVCAADLTACAVQEAQPEQSQQNENPPAEQENPAPVCICTTRCAEGNGNPECPVCGADPSGCTGKAPEAPVCTCTTRCAEGNGNPECPVCAADPSGCTGKAPEAPVCTCTTKCAEGSVNPDCPVCGVEGADLTACAGPESTEKEADEAVAAVQAAVDALPTAEELTAMPQEEQQAVYTALQTAYGAYQALTEEQKAQVTGAEQFEALFAAFNAMAAPLVDGSLTKLVVGSTTVVENSQTTENTSGQGWSYDVGSNTLTLDNATINGTDTIGHVGAGIFASGDLTIVLEGSSTVTGVQDPNGDSQSIRVEGNLTIQGGGSLTAQGAETSSGSSYGIFVIGSFTQQGGSVTASGGNINGNYTSTGLYVYGSTVTVQGGTLTATGGTTGSGSYGISANGSVTVSDATVTATGGSAGYASYGLYIGSSSPSVTLSGSSSLTARSGSATDTAGGIYLNNIWGSTGSVTVGNGSTLLTNSVILYDNSFTEKPLAPTGNGSWLIYGQSDQPSAVGGNYTLTDDLTIDTLTIPAGSTLTVPKGATLTVNSALNIANQSSLAGEGTLAGSGTFTMTNPDPVISGSDTLTYDGTDQFDEFKLEAPSGSVEVMGQSFTISSSPILDGWTLETLEIINAGTYTLTAKHTDGRTIRKQVTVSKATSNIAFGNYSLNYTYTGTALANPTADQLTLSGAGYNDVTFTWYKGASPDGTELDSAPTDAGTYYLVASIPESKNTSGSEETSGAITISAKEISIASATVQDKTYDGTNTATVGTVTFNNLVNGESLTINTDYTATATFADKNAGDSKQATVTVTLKNGNYTFAGSQNTAATIATATIKKRPVTLSWNYNGPFTYDGTQKSVAARLTVMEDDGFFLVYTGNTATNAGNYTARVTGLTGFGADNYTLDGVENTSLEWSITSASITGAEVLLSQSSFTYDGSEHKPTVIVTLNGKTLTENTDYTVTYDGDTTNAGTVTVKVSGKGNYAGTTSKTFTIAKAPLTIGSVDVQSKTYDGTTAATITGVSFKGLVNGEALAMGTDYTALADFADAAAGTDKSVTGKVTLLSSAVGKNYTLSGNTFAASANITIAPSKLDFKADRTKPVKGQVVIFSVTPQLKGDNRSFLQRVLGIDAPKVEFWVGSTKLGEVKVEEGKTSTFAYDTDKGGLKLGKNTVTAKFTGSGNLQGCEETLAINLQTTSASAPTGDTSNIQLWTAALAASVLALAGVGVGTVLYRKKRK